MTAALFALIDESNAYQETAQNQPPILAMYATKIETMATNLQRFYDNLEENVDSIKTYIENLNNSINTLMIENQALKQQEQQTYNKSNLSGTMQNEIQTTLKVQTYINYSLYLGLLLELAAMGFAMMNPNAPVTSTSTISTTSTTTVTR